MLFQIIKCDWCGYETKYDSQFYSTVEFIRVIPEWADASVAKYDICVECREALTDLIVHKRSKES